MEPFSASRSNPERARPAASPYIQHYSNKLTFNLSNTVTGVHTMKTRALIAAFALSAIVLGSGPVLLGNKVDDKLSVFIFS